MKIKSIFGLNTKKEDDFMDEIDDKEEQK
jgi:hypothetical protein